MQLRKGLDLQTKIDQDRIGYGNVGNVGFGG